MNLEAGKITAYGALCRACFRAAFPAGAKAETEVIWNEQRKDGVFRYE